MNGLRVDFQDYQDSQLEFRVGTFLKSRNFPEFKNLEILASDGVVTLSGTLRSYYEKQVAINSCLRVAGVATLIDKIDIKVAKPK